MVRILGGTMTIRYPSILDMTDELNQLNDIIEKIEHVHIIEITHSLITISDKYEEYEYDSILEAIASTLGATSSLRMPATLS